MHNKTLCALSIKFVVVVSGLPFMHFGRCFYPKNGIPVHKNLRFYQFMFSVGIKLVTLLVLPKQIMNVVHLHQFLILD